MIGAPIVDSVVLPLACIPSRSDPVGTFLDITVVSAAVDDREVTVELGATEVRFGSHPSGCSGPVVLPAQSVFLLGDDRRPLFATSAATAAGETAAGEGTSGSGTTLTFDLNGRPAESLSVMLAPTIGYLLGNGDRQTTTYGLVGVYDLPAAPARFGP